jgi:ubiquinone/menaquinone biosynthesis C-methylase UbiE
MSEMPPPDQLFIIAPQQPVLKDFTASGWILDVGGGGEGIIGRLKGNQVIAIDVKKEELDDAPPGPLKIIMDATDLKFLDDTFDTVTAFFTLMYINPEHRPKVFSEVARVLKPGGKFHLWDVNIPKCTDKTKPWFVVPIVIKLPQEEVQTGYGVHWQGREQSITDYTQLAQQKGFTVKSQQPQDQMFYLKLVK